MSVKTSVKNNIIIFLSNMDLNLIWLTFEFKLRHVIFDMTNKLDIKLTC
jgi:hypothetical protein